MNSNKDNNPRRYNYSDNMLYNGYLDDLNMSDWDSESTTNPKRAQWKRNNRKDIFHDPIDGVGYYEDAYTVAQKFMDRRQFPHG